MLQSNLDDVKSAALKAKQRLQLSAQEKDRAVTLYLHWSAGHYGQFFSAPRVSGLRKFFKTQISP